MKKILISLVILISSLNSMAISENLYLKGTYNISKTNPIQERDPTMKFNLQQESKFSPSVSISVGHYINKMHRTEITLEYLSFYFFDKAGNFDYTENDTLVTGSKIVQRIAFGHSIMFNNYIDVLQRDRFNIFVGCGVGVVKIKEKIQHLASGNALDNIQLYTFPLIIEDFTSKSRMNLAHAVMLGASIKLNPEINLELMYSWKDFGKTKFLIGDTKNHYRSHNISMGLRLDL